MHYTLKKIILFHLNWDLYKWIRFRKTAFLQIRPLEIILQRKLVLQSIGLVRIGTYFPSLIIKHQKETSIDIILIKLNTFQLIPKVPLIAHQIPPQLFLIKIKIHQMLIIPSLNRLKLFFSCHFLFFRERQYIGNLSLIIVKSPIQLTTRVTILELLCMPQYLDMNHWTDIYLFKLEV